VIDDKLEAVDALLTTTGVYCAIGWVHIPEHDSPPRLVWVSSSAGDQLTAPTSLGSNEYQAINDHWVALEAHVWAISGEQLCAIIHNVCLALREVFYGPQVRLGAVKWGKDARTAKGLVGIMAVQVKIPVLDAYCTIPTAPSATAQQPAAASTVLVVAQSVTAQPGEVKPLIHSATYQDPVPIP
jgi:hypothetical protein